MKYLLAFACLLQACVQGHLSTSTDIGFPKNTHPVSAFWPAFDRLPEKGAEYHVELFVRLACRKHPHWLLDPLKGYVGHVFLALKKRNGPDSLVQYFGFYPRAGFPGVFNNKPVDAALADNANHQYDASFGADLNREKFDSLMLRAQSLAKTMRYQTYKYNCVDFATELMNSIVSGNAFALPQRKHSLLPKYCHTPEDLFFLIINKKLHHESEEF